MVRLSSVSLPLSTRTCRAELSYPSGAWYGVSLSFGSAPRQQQSSQLGVMRDSGCAVEGAFPFGLGLVVRFKPAGVRAGAGVQQRLGRSHEAGGPAAIEPEISREAKVRERSPIRTDRASRWRRPGHS